MSLGDQRSREDPAGLVSPGTVLESPVICPACFITGADSPVSIHSSTAKVRRFDKMHVAGNTVPFGPQNDVAENQFTSGDSQFVPVAHD